ncbi:MAG: hypothetical protein M1829_000179 [Trizodia sp. TS-e1964]|nr:MAG: hypothetical protein M1829_000179 [Trizodia sp. TS-e1964]
MALSSAKVKSVLAGDTLILTSVNNPNNERVLHLAFVTAPRLRKERDEPYAFESRDFLRQLVVGKVVRFRVLYQNSSNKNEYGIVMGQDGWVLPDRAVSEGWLKLRDDAGRNSDQKGDDNDEMSLHLEKLTLLEAKAKSESKGLWAINGQKVESAKELQDPQEFAEQWKGKTIDAIIERVLSGDRLIARLMLSPTLHQQTIIMIAGIRAPGTKRTNPSDGKEQLGEELGDEAQQFVETRLLQRNVKIDILGVTPQNQLVGAVKHPVGSIAEFLLKAGLARCTDFHSTWLGADMAALRRAEKGAKDQNLGVFKGHVSKNIGANGNKEAIVTKIQSADTIFLRVNEGSIKRINLSSIRQPKPSDPKQSPFIAEAKEFLRKKIIGKQVKFVVDGIRPAQDNYDEREVATVLLNDKNIALLLVENGYASVIRHRRDDEDRSPIYDELLAAEEEAQKGFKGMHAKKPPTSKAYIDYSESATKAKIQLSSLQRQKKIPAVIDFVKSGSRFTVLLPRENAKLTLVLSGIRTPKAARNQTETSEPFGTEAQDFAEENVAQRDVEVIINNVDKSGGFIGNLYVKGESFAKRLVARGFATVHAYSAEQSGNANELFAAEKAAKEARKGVWHDWDPSKEQDEPSPTNNETDPEPSARERDYRDVEITTITKEGKLKLQQIGNGTALLSELMSKFKSFQLNPTNRIPLPGPPKAGDFVAAKFSLDGNWYRARILHNDREAKKAEVLYIDYGNVEKLPWAELRPLTQSQFTTQTLKAQATDAVLSFLQLPAQPDYLADATDYLERVTSGKQLVAKVDFVAPDGTLHVTLFDPKVSGSAGESFNADMVAEGLAMVARKLSAWERSATTLLSGLKAKEEAAKSGRKGIWEYGDLTED